MRRHTIVLLLFLVSNTLMAQQTWQWAAHVGSDFGPYTERAKAITDGTNTYLIGTYGGTLYLSSDTLLSYGNNDMFISKFDSAGNELWAKTFGGNNFTFLDWENVTGVYDTTYNCIYLSGKFFGTIAFGSIPILSSIGGMDIFLAKMDTNGNFIWAKRAGSIHDDNAQVYLNKGNVYMIAQVTDSAIFDSIHVPNGGILAIYDSSGTCIRAEMKYSHIDSSWVYLSFLDNDLILFGSFRSSQFSIDTANLTSNGNYDGFICRTDSIGNVKWRKTVYGTQSQQFLTVAVDNYRNIYASFSFQDTTYIDNDTLIATSNFSTSLIKMSELADIIWTKSVNSAVIGTLTCSPDNNICISGSFWSSASFDGITMNSSFPYDMFIARYDSSGNCIGADHFGQASCLSHCMLSDGTIICTGVFVNVVSIDSSQFTSLGSYDIFLTNHNIITGAGDGDRHSTNNQLIIYANPNAGKCNITVPDEFLHEKKLTLTIYDNMGKLIQQKVLGMNEGKIKLNLEAEAKGIYNVTLSNGVKMYYGKIVFE